MEIKSLFRPQGLHEDGQNPMGIMQKGDRTGAFDRVFCKIRNLSSLEPRVGKENTDKKDSEEDNDTPEHKKSAPVRSLGICNPLLKPEPEIAGEDPDATDPEPGRNISIKSIYIGADMAEYEDTDLSDLQGLGEMSHISLYDQAIPETEHPLDTLLDPNGPNSNIESKLEDKAINPKVEVNSKYALETHDSHSLAQDLKSTYKDIDDVIKVTHLSEDFMSEGKQVENKVDSAQYFGPIDGEILSENMGDDIPIRSNTRLVKGNNSEDITWKAIVNNKTDSLWDTGYTLSDEDHGYDTTQEGFDRDTGEFDDVTQTRDLGLANSIMDSEYLDFSGFISARKSSDSMSPMDIIAHKMVTVLNSNETRLEVQLYPKQLGRIILEVFLEDGALMGRISACTKEARDMLQSGIEDLQVSLGEQGLAFASLDVNVDERSEPRNFSQEPYGIPRINRTKAGPIASEVRALGEDKHNGIAGGAGPNRIDYLA